MAVASPGALPTNLLTAADSDFESGPGSWIQWISATGLTGGTAWAWTGSQCLAWNAAAAGNTGVASGFYPVQASKPYIASAVVDPSAARSCEIGIAWYNGSTLINTVYGQTVSVPAGNAGGFPVTVATVAPSNATQCRVAVNVLSAANGETERVDFVFITQTDTQVLVDWWNPPFGASSIAGSAFFDLSMWARLDEGITLGRGRQDAVSEVPAGSATIKVYNTYGWFTSNNSNSPWYGSVKLGRRMQVNMADETGTWHTRYDGPIGEIDHSFDPNGEAEATLQGSDVLGFLARQNELSCWTQEQVMATGPQWHWTLDDATGSQIAAESSGNNGPPLKIMNFGTGASVAFSQGAGGVETMADTNNANTDGPFTSPLPSPAWTTTTNHATGSNAWALNGSANLTVKLPTALQTTTGNAFTLEAWLMPGAALTGNPANLSCAALSLADTRTGKNVLLAWQQAAWVNYGYNKPPASLGTSSGYTPPVQFPSAAYNVVPANYPQANVPIHVAVVVTGNGSGATYQFYVNGVLQTPSTGSTGGMKGFKPNQLDVGGCFGGYGGWLGSISSVSIYTSALSTAQIQANYGMGWDGMYLNTTAQCVQQLAGYANLPAFWSNLSSATGLTKTEYFDISNQDALTCMQEFEQAELAGLLYVNAAGQLCFDGRQIRMGTGTPSLTVPAGSYDPGTGHKVTDQYLQNQAAINTPATSKGSFAVNPKANADYGPYSNGTPKQPNTIPLLAVNPWFNGRGLSSQGIDLDYVQDAVNWIANANATPPVKAASITLDLLTPAPTSPEYIAPSTAYGMEINTTFTLGQNNITAMPTDTGALDYYVEGISEFKSLTAHTLTIYTSPVNASRAWKPGDPVWGVLDSTALIGVSKTDDGNALAPNAKIHEADPGYPYWAPTYNASMNSGGVGGKNFVGARDQRGIGGLLTVVNTPPLCIVSQQNTTTQSASGSSTWNTLQWDTTHIDTAQGMGLLTNWPNWYVVVVPGYYELDATVIWAAQGSGSPSNRGAFFRINYNGTLISAGNSPTTAGQANQIGGAFRRANTSQSPGCSFGARLYLGVGTTVGITVWQDSGSTLTTLAGGDLAAATLGGSMMSIRWVGFSTTAD